MIKNIHKKGFTLIELLLVIAIVTLLSSAFFYNSSEARKKAEDAHMAEETRQVATAIQIYSDDKGEVPYGPSSQHSTPHKEATPEYSESLQSLVSEGYISEIPTSPSGDSYYYGFSEDKKRGYILYNSNKEGPKCEVIGNGDSSCDEFLASINNEDNGDEESNDPCLQPPILTGVSNYQQSSGSYGSYNISFQINASDPENETISFAYIFAAANPFYGVGCSINSNGLVSCSNYRDNTTVLIDFYFRAGTCENIESTAIIWRLGQQNIFFQ